MHLGDALGGVIVHSYPETRVNFFYFLHEMEKVFVHLVASAAFIDFFIEVVFEFIDKPHHSGQAVLDAVSVLGLIFYGEFDAHRVETS